ncbi:hypothetical protein DPMN_154083 [Dreissena polymorpha]|uniref:Uncharacterized protein n=1 Tax=Dreissena polymorpha TaxID=45954 RepID=A0A9D4J6N5_DREPO|nr:hypothetical protein DPMN_154083 [Dreissena polymorpha]
MPRPLGGHIFPRTGTIFELIQDIIGTNCLTKFLDDRTINQYISILGKNAPPPGAHFRTHPNIIGTNRLTKFHEDRKINVASRVLTRKNASRPGGHVLQPTSIILNSSKILLFHDDRTINVASRVKNAPPPGGHQYLSILGQNAPPPGKNLLTKFHEVRKINVASIVFTIVKNGPPHGSHVFQANVTSFELIQDIIETNLLTKLHEDLEKNAPHLGSHVFQANVTIFELIQDIIEVNLLTKCHEDWTINVASRVLTTQMLTPHNARRTTHDARLTKGDHKNSP